jgi:hypothetical protein
MKKRSYGFLSDEKIDHSSEQFDYIRELHDYLWIFVRAEIPGASGHLNELIDIAAQSALYRTSKRENSKI